jgi:hypothetical protein
MDAVGFYQTGLSLQCVGSGSLKDKHALAARMYAG